MAAFSPQDIAMLFNGAMQNYLFRFAFESRNPGCEFDMDKWVEDLNNLAPDDLMIMTPEKELEMQKILDNLDDYAVKKKSSIELV